MTNWKPTQAPQAKYKKEVLSKIAAVADIIYQLGEYPELRKRSREIPLDQITAPDTQAKITYLKDCMTEHRKRTGMGRGITAVQVGVPERLSVVFTSEKLIIIINPVVTSQSDKKYRFPEMCMSTNFIIAPTVRPAWIEFDYYDEDGKKQTWRTKDDTDQGRILNRVFQHEIDHMDGIVNIDRCQSKDLTLEADPHFYESATFEVVQ